MRSRRSDREGTALLTAHLGAERRGLLGLLALLVVAMLLPVSGPVLVGVVVDQALSGEPTSRLLVGAGLFIAAMLTADALQLVVTWFSVKLAWRVGNEVRLDLARHALQLDLTWHGDHSPGLLIERIDGDIEAIVTFASAGVLNLLGNAILLTGTLVVAVVIDWRAGLLIAGVAAAAVLVLRRLRLAGVPYYETEREVQGGLYGDLEERLGGLEDLRANGAAEYVVHRLHTASAAWWRIARQASWRGDGGYALSAGTFTAGSVATLALSLLLVTRGELTLGAAFTLFRFAQMVRNPLESVAEQIAEFQRAVAGARRATQLLAAQPRVADGHGARIPEGPLSVDLQGVSFAYPDEPDRLVLTDVDLHIPAGHVVGVVGRTGSGKTSLGRLLVRFWDPTSGRILLGGTAIAHAHLDHLRHRVGVVSQEVQVLRASIRDNLTLFGSVDADDAAVASALEQVGLAEWLGSQPEGLATELAGAEELSAGQAQLLSFARILLADPGLVVLDEATSRLDPATEARLALAADRARIGRTVVVIAHRLETVVAADLLVVVEDGRVVEVGPPDDLRADPGSRFSQMTQDAGLAGGGRR